MINKRNFRMIPGLILLAIFLSGCLANIPNNPPSAEAPSEIEPGPSDAAAAEAGESAPVFNQNEGEAVSPDTTAIPAGTTFDSPWRYCEAVYTIDSPGIEYVGEKPNSTVKKKLLSLVGISEADGSGHSTVWRCMDGQVYGCDVTLSAHCLTKMTLLALPSAAMVEECSKPENAGVVLPTAVTGPETPYEWTCIANEPVITRQGITVDPRDFNANIWYLIYEN